MRRKAFNIEAHWFGVDCCKHTTIKPKYPDPIENTIPPLECQTFSVLVRSIPKIDHVCVNICPSMVSRFYHTPKHVCMWYLLGKKKQMEHNKDKMQRGRGKRVPLSFSREGCGILVRMMNVWMYIRKLYFVDSHLLESMFLVVRKSEPPRRMQYEDKQLGDARILIIRDHNLPLILITVRKQGHGETNWKFYEDCADRSCFMRCFLLLWFLGAQEAGVFGGGRVVPFLFEGCRRQ